MQHLRFEGLTDDHLVKFAAGLVICGHEILLNADARISMSEKSDPNQSTKISKELKSGPHISDLSEPNLGFLTGIPEMSFLYNKAIFCSNNSCFTLNQIFLLILLVYDHFQNVMGLLVYSVGILGQLILDFNNSSFVHGIQFLLILPRTTKSDRFCSFQMQLRTQLRICD